MNEIYAKKTSYIDADGNEVEFMIYPLPTLRMKLEFVTSVVNTVVSDNYYKLLEEPLFVYQLISNFTNINPMDIIGKESYGDATIDDIEYLLSSTNIVNVMLENMDLDILEELLDAVEHDIEYRTGIHNGGIDKAIVSLINTLESKMKDFDFGDISNVSSALSKISNELTTEKFVDALVSSESFREHILNDNVNVENNTKNISPFITA